jgi:cellulose synthase (UDP-forming)
LFLAPQVLILLFLVSLPLNWKDQAILGALLIVLAYLINAFSPGRRTTILLMMVTCFCTARYAYYRFSETAWNVKTSWSQVHALDLFFVGLLLAAESYAFLILFLGCFQTIRPLRRKPIQLPEDERTWPKVDVFIPTYNEPLEVVKPTVLAALNMDWPADLYRVCILDDGRRRDFEEFAEACGADYITRLDNAHAKAGNINHALRQTDGDYITIFDCDHIPTRSFLQMTMGWMLTDPKLAMLQTPHHYYSPDPFEKNLGIFREVPNEGALFYGIIQDGNDLWNATFFCGSCAVLRRTALEAIGGVAVETVTEDAHTALRMHCKGWNTAYINIPQAAGLATSRLADHVGQRIRWARGMVQILRVDCPLFARGLKLPQRLCYFNAMLHFLFAGPRLIFLTSPLIYLILGRYNVFGYLPAILAYAVPHLFISTMTNSRVQGKHRHSFWNEIYEIVLAPYILLPTLLALINPKWGKFNVTAKSSLIEGTYFDWQISKPFVILVILNLVGIGMGIHQYITQGNSNGVLGINLFWASFNILLLGGALAVAQERQQRRAHVRVAAQLPLEVILPTGEAVAGKTLDLSNGGIRARVVRAGVLAANQEAKVVLSLFEQDFVLPVRVVDARGSEVRFEFGDLTLVQQAALARLVFARADNWLDWSKGYKVDKPLRSMGAILVISCKGLILAVKAIFKKAPKPTPKPAAAKPVAVGLVLLLAFLYSRAALCAPPAPARPAASQIVAATPGFQDERTLLALGYKAALSLRGSSSRARVYFGVPLTKLVSNARLDLQYRVSPGLVADTSQINVLLNGSSVGVVPVKGTPDSANVIARAEVSVAPELFLPENALTFELTGTCAAGCEESDESGVWASIEPGTELHMSGTLLPLANNLRLLPAPFFDATAQRLIDLPFVLDEHPNASTLMAAGIVASWFGIKADYRGIRFPVKSGEIPPGNVVLVGTNGTPAVASLGVQASSPTILIRDNPNDPYGKVLAIIGADDHQLPAAARAFALGAYRVEGDQAGIESAELPPVRRPYDAPKWLQTDREVRLTDGVSDSDLQVLGNGSVKLYFRLPPDLHYAAREIVPLRLKYRCSRLLSARRAEVKVHINGNYVASRPIPLDSQTDLQEEIIPLPAPALYGRNTLTVEFSFERVRIPESAGHLPRASVLRSTELLIQGMSHFVEMPQLNLFGTTGFPFTRLADLSETVVDLPAKPTQSEVSLFLGILGFMGAQTGYPATRVSVLEGATPSAGADKDVLLLGTYDDQPLLKQWGDAMLVRTEDGHLRMASPLGLGRLFELMPWTQAAHEQRGLDLLLQDDSAIEGIIQGFRSPLSPDRSVVSLATPGRDLNALADAWSPFSPGFQISGGASVLYSGQLRSFDVNRKRYYAGQLDNWQAVQYWTRRYYWLSPILVFGWIFVLALVVDRWIEAIAAWRLQLQ